MIQASFWIRGTLQYYVLDCKYRTHKADKLQSLHVKVENGIRADAWHCSVQKLRRQRDQTCVSSPPPTLHLQAKQLHVVSMWVWGGEGEHMFVIHARPEREVLSFS